MPATFVSPTDRPIYDRWIILEKGSTQLVALKDGAGYKVSPGKKHVLPVREIDSKSKNISAKQRVLVKKVESKGQRLFLLSGKQVAHMAELQARKGKLKAKSLNVDIVKPIEVPVQFHIVRHLPGNIKTLTPHSAKWTAKADLESGLDFAGVIFRAAAIRFKLEPPKYADINSDVGKQFVIKDCKTSKDYALLSGSVPSVINVFVIGKLVNQSHSNGKTCGTDVIVDTGDKSLEEFGRLLAHEFGHVFGFDTHARNVFKRTKAEISRSAKPKPTRYLMAVDHPDADFFDSGITRNQGDRMRTGAKKLVGKRAK